MDVPAASGELKIEESGAAEATSGFVTVAGKQVSTRLLLIIGLSVGGVAVVGLAVGLGVGLSTGTKIQLEGFVKELIITLYFLSNEFQLICCVYSLH